eukprot:2152290-Pyramimonas_sp.AAC.1
MLPGLPVKHAGVSEKHTSPWGLQADPARLGQRSVRWVLHEACEAWQWKQARETLNLPELAQGCPIEP